MKFLVDAQLPRRLAELLKSFGHDAIHTLDLPAKNRTTDQTLCQIAMDQARVLITKDADFVDSYLLRGTPPNLLLVTAGNINNDELLNIFRANLDAVEKGLSVPVQCSFVEIDRSGLTIHL